MPYNKHRLSMTENPVIIWVAGIVTGEGERERREEGGRREERRRREEEEGAENHTIMPYNKHRLSSTNRDTSIDDGKPGHYLGRGYF
jgi:hypothetical protein